MSVNVPQGSGRLFSNRWRLLVAWVIVFTFATGYSIRATRDSVDELKTTKASIAALQHTNCGLKNFLLTALHARQNAARNANSAKERKNDLMAVRQYRELLKPFDKDSVGPSCSFSKSLKGG